ncbi:MAG: hypothetical protein O2904_00840 [bacterium]|nr:hypothetical protein [bacterium]
MTTQTSALPESESQDAYAEVENPIGPVKSGVFMQVDGIEYNYGFNREKNHTIDGRFDSDGYLYRIAHVGTYCSNNGTLAYIDENGFMNVGLNDERNIEALESANYVSGEFAVPFSNGEMATDRAAYEQLRDVMTGMTPEELEEHRSTEVNRLLEERRQLFAQVAEFPEEDVLYEQVAEQTEGTVQDVSEFATEHAGKKLERDNAGADRAVYSVNGKTFAFRSREELPEYETAAASKTRMVGGGPRETSLDDFQEYEQRMSVGNEGSSEHLSATKSLLGVVETAIALGSEDESLEVLKEEIQSGHYSKRALALIDAIIACDYVSYSEFTEEKTTDGEAVVVLALMGDRNAQEIVAKKLHSLQYTDAHIRDGENFYRDLKKTEGEPFDTSELAIVHATSYEPQRTEEGEFDIRTTFDATNGEIPRNSMHTTLNHKVTSHMQGNWDSSGYTLVSTLDNMMEANGPPMVLHSIDTYWTRDPGEKLRFHNAVMVRWGGDLGDDFYKRDGEYMNVKSEGFTAQDIVKLNDMAEMRSNVYGLSVELSAAFQRYVKDESNALLKTVDSTKVFENFGMSPYIPVSPIFSEIAEMVESSSKPISIAQAITAIFDRYNVREAISGENAENTYREMCTEFSQVVEGKFASIINQQAVNDVIRSMDCKVAAGNPSHWVGEMGAEEYRLRILANAIGSRTGKHEGQPDLRTTQNWIEADAKARTEEHYRDSAFDWTKYTMAYEVLLPKVDQKTRRMLYASGLMDAVDKTEALQRRKQEKYDAKETLSG